MPQFLAIFVYIQYFLTINKNQMVKVTALCFFKDGSMKMFTDEYSYKNIKGSVEEEMIFPTSTIALQSTQQFITDFFCYDGDPLQMSLHLFMYITSSSLVRKSTLITYKDVKEFGIIFNLIEGQGADIVTMPISQYQQGLNNLLKIKK